MHSEVYQSMCQFVQQWYMGNQEKDLNALLNEPYLVNPELVFFIDAERQNILETINKELKIDPLQQRNGLVFFFVNTTINFLYSKNQFLQLTSEDKQQFVQLYQDYMQEFARILCTCFTKAAIEEELKKVFKKHFQLLVRLILDIFHRAGLESYPFSGKEIICAEYSVKLQFDVLGIRLEELLEPVLDIGCGREGNLVKYLARLGINAYGIDRQTGPFELLFEADWLEFEYSRQAWGTLISHMAFSNHFIFQHLNPSGLPEQYARKYMQILSSLKSGGSFYYSPGLPFIECFLPEDTFYFSKTHELNTNLEESDQGKIFSEALGVNPFYCAQVYRLN